MKNITLIILGLTFFACSNNEPKEVEIVKEIIEEPVVEIAEPDEEITEDDAFLVFYSSFSSAIIAKSYSGINSLINPDFGLYVIEAPGAMPVITKISDTENFKLKITNKKMFEIDFPEMAKEFVYEALPKVICNAEVFDKQGCFAEAVNPLKESQIWNYAGLNEKEIQAVEVLANTVEMTVVNTSNYTYYFSIMENHWYLTFIDLRVPCTA